MLNAPHTPRLGFLGVGRIGLRRMASVAAAGSADIVAVADPVPGFVEEALAIAPGAKGMQTLSDLLAADLDAVVIATPSALHAEQACVALARGRAVFCQKPLGRNAAEARMVVDAARNADLLLGVDLSYRFTDAMKKIRALIRNGELGDVFAAELVFHNAYGPDKPWFYDRKLSGGGCLIDLGIHLVDLLLWTLDSPVSSVSGRLFTQGRLLPPDPQEVEDYALARITLASGAVAQIVCSWKAHAGRDSVIEASFHGTNGGAAMLNINGSFREFSGERYRGTASEIISSPPDEWGGGAILDWLVRLANGSRFDPEIERIVEVTKVLDQISRGGNG